VETVGREPGRAPHERALPLLHQFLEVMNVELVGVDDERVARRKRAHGITTQNRSET
jgi:hypothetical protein